MRILYLHQYFNTRRMAGGTRSYEMARRLVTRGHEVHMITSYRGSDPPLGRDWFETEEDGIHVHWIPVPYSNYMSYRERIQAFFRFALAAGRRAAEVGGDVVFATSTPLTIAIPGVYAARRCRVPMVFEVRDLWPELPIAMGVLKDPVSIWAARRLERFAYKHSARIVALSPDMKDGVVATGYPADRVEVIPNSCDLDLFDVGPEPGVEIRNRYEWLQRRPLVLYCGTLGAINGVDYLARVAREVQALDPEVRFVVIGDGKDKPRVEHVAGELGVLDRNFFMVPSIPKTEVPSWLSAADLATSLFIDLPEMWANSANKFFDALAAGRPVAINYGGWQARLLTETGAGVVLDPHDVVKAAHSLLGVIRDKNWLRSAGHAAHSLAAEQFSRDRLALKLEEVLIQATSSRKS